MQRWEHKAIEIRGRSAMVEFGDDREDRETLLRQLGNEGWELAGVAGSDDHHNYTLYFKRPKE